MIYNGRQYCTPLDAEQELKIFSTQQIGFFLSANIIRGLRQKRFTYVCLDDLKNLVSIRIQILNDMPLILRQKQI